MDFRKLASDLKSIGTFNPEVCSVLFKHWLTENNLDSTDNIHELWERFITETEC